jgi:hypothetical protein
MLRRPKVLNRHKIKLTGENMRSRAKYVGRPSKFGNQHPIGSCPLCRLEHTREEAIAAYKKDLTPELVQVIKEELRGCNLICWCAPKPCHADILLEIANA